VDAAVYFSPNERLRMQLNVENLLDEGYYPNAHNNNNITPGSPLAVRVGVTANF
jgi:catecholate siderophore receptor